MGTAGLAQGFQVDQLLSRVLIDRQLNEALRLRLDYDASRAGLQLPGLSDVYSLRYVGPQEGFLREVDLGNVDVTIPGTRFAPLVSGGPDSFALRVLAGAPAGSPGLGLDALLRLGASREATRKFHGTQRVFDEQLADVGYVRGRFFLLPDAGVDEASVRLLGSSPTGAESIDGKPFTLLSPGRDYELDNVAGRLYLAGSLADSEELVVTYQKQGLSVGDVSLGMGRKMIVAPDGSRQDFDTAGCPQYFGAAGVTPYLYLRRGGLNDYWEMRNAYPLENAEGQLPGDVSVEVLYTRTGAVNGNYRGLLDRFNVSQRFGAVFFEFADSAGFYPRPFPGEHPFTDPVTPDNPFDPANPVYGGLSYPGESSSISTLKIRYSLSGDTYLLDSGIIADSVRVTVDGAPVEAARYDVDPLGGTITFHEGAIGPASEIEVSYSYVSAGGGERSLLAALTAGSASDILSVRNTATLSLPIEEAPSPRIGQEKSGVFRDGLDASLTLGARQGEQGFTLGVTGSAGVSVTDPNPAGFAIVADMEEEQRFALSMDEGAWTLASRSLLLPPAGVSLQDRGGLWYRSCWEDPPLSSGILHDLAWGVSANAPFPYADKAGPYSSADKAPGGSDRSLVLETDFAGGSFNPFTSVVSVFSQTDLSSYQTFDLVLRGSGVSGGDLAVYVEILSVYQEDLNGNDAIDGELSADQKGYRIVPVGGTATVIGTDRHGAANGKRDTEDLNGNGILDPPGPFAMDQETGTILLRPSGLPSAPLAIVPAGESDWQHVAVDILALAAANPSSFQRAAALRITVMPASGSPLAARVSGRVLVNGAWFSASGMDNKAPSVLSLRELSLAESPELAAQPFSGAYPALYEKLHGSPSYRARQGLVERTLLATLESPLAPGADASLSRTFGWKADFSGYQDFRMYLFLPSAGLLPDASFVLTFASGGTGKLVAEIPVPALRAGWNEVSASLAPPFPVSVNGTPITSLLASGAPGVLEAVAVVSLGLRAGASGVAAGTRVWLDEWHLEGSRLSVDPSLSADVVTGYRGALLAVGGLPVISDLLLSAGWDGGSIGGFDAPDRTAQAFRAGLGATLAGALSASAAWSRATQALSDSRYGSVTETWSLRAVLTPPLAYLPVIEHRWARSESTSTLPTETPQQSRTERRQADVETLSFSETFAPAAWLKQSYAFSRTWTSADGSAIDEGTGVPADSWSSLRLEQAHEGTVTFTPGGALFTARFADLSSFISAEPTRAAAGAGSYVQRMGTLLEPAPQAVGSGQPALRRDSLAASLSIPRVGYAGVDLKWETSMGTLNFDAGTAARDVATATLISISLPVSPDGKGTFQLVPQVSLGLNGSYPATAPGRDGLSLLLAPYPSLLSLLPSFLDPSRDWGRAAEMSIVDSFSGDSLVAGSSSNTLQAMLSVQAILAQPPWFLPGIAGLSLKDDTTRAGGGYAQKRTAAAWLTRADQEPAESVGFALDLRGELSADYATKVLGYTLNGKTGLRIPISGRGNLKLDESLSFTRQRQLLDDETMALFPGQPDRELPVAPRADRDEIRNSSGVSWTVYRGLGGYPRVENTEALLVENIFQLSSAQPEETDSIPLRGRFSHSSRVTISDSWEVTLGLTAAAGLEEKVTPLARLLLPSLGFEVRVGAFLHL